MTRKTKRKPPAKVVGIAGAHEPDVITQAELREIADLQAAEWLAADSAHAAVYRIRHRLRQGAVIEGGELAFDTELKMVRTHRPDSVMPAGPTDRRKSGTGEG